MKQQIGSLDAVPSKRLFLSIIADYDLNRSICELVDNGLDVWIRSGRSENIEILVDINLEQRTICVTDNAGGLPKEELRYIVGPGQTGSSPSDETIGIFGVGTKRAVVALAQDIKIRTRHGTKATHQVDFDDTWLADDDWKLPLYEVDSIPPGVTSVELQKLRVQISEEVIAQLRDHLQATYAKFLKMQGVTIKLNNVPLASQFFDNWAFPPGYEPRRYHGNLKTEDGREIRIEAVAGLSNESSPATGEYGVYFYCNDRLIARAVKNFEVGFMKGYAGLPHPKVSLTKVIVSLNGDARSMPWNSSKSDISTKHEVFQALHAWLNQVVKDYAALSRIWMGDWPEKVFKYADGEIVDVPVDDFPAAKKSYLPPMPKSRPRYADLVVHVNQTVAKKKPWVRGLYEGVIAADLIAKLQLEQRNRIALIVLDSTLEIAFKEYLVHDSGQHYSDAQLLSVFKTRHTVHTEIKKYVNFSPTIWGKVAHYSDLRNKLIHQRATAGVSDTEIIDFRDVVEGVLKKLYALKFNVK
jgi:Histidine kinase-, DNA gyrase B-, and HSP90-like ATPase